MASILPRASHWSGVRFMTKADAWVTVAVVAAIVILSLAGVVGAIALSTNPNASLLVPIILGATAPTVVTLLNFVNSRNTARKIDHLNSKADTIQRQTNGDLGKNVEDAADRAVERALTRILDGNMRRAGEPHAPFSKDVPR